MKLLPILSLWLASCILSLGAGALNGVAVTHWNGIAFTAWNGSGVSAAGGGGGGVPSTNLIMDLDADSIGQADNTTANVVWQDSSAADNDMTLANGPTLQTLERNGHSAVQFDNANDYGISALNLTRPYTVYLVEEVATNDYNRTLNSASGNYLIANGRNSLVCLAGSTASPVTAYSGSAVVGCLVAPASGNATYYLNGADITSSAATAVDWGTVTIGASGSFPEPANTKFFRLLIYSADHDAAGLRVSTTATLGTIYTITIP